MGLVVIYDSGDAYNDTLNYKFILQFNCEEGRENSTYVLDSDSIKTPYEYRVIIKSSHACPVMSIWELWYFFQDYDYLFGFVMLFVGGYYISVGGRFYKATMFMTATITFGLAFLLALFATVYPSYSPEWVAWITLIVGLSIGAGLGYAAQRWPFFGVLILGTILGGFLGSFIFAMGMYDFASEHPNVVLWCTMAGMAALIAIISIIFYIKN